MQAVGQPRHDALQMRELLVEIAAQPLQLVVVAEILGVDDLVEFRREGVIFRTAVLVLPARIRPRRLARRLVVAEVAVVERVAGGGLRAFHRALRHFVGGGLRLVGAHLLRGVAIGRALGAGLVVLAVAVVVLVLVIVGIGVAVVAKLQRRQQIMHRVAEFRLVLGEAIEPVEPRADLVFQHRPPQVDHLARRGGRRQAGETLAHQHRQRVGQRRVGAVGDLVEFSTVKMIVEHGGEVFCDAGHAARPERLDAGLFDGFEHAARLRIARHQLAMHFRIVAGEFQRDGIGVAAHDGGIAPRHLARGLRQPRLAGREPGTFGGEGHFQLRRFRDRAQARRHRALERLGRRLPGAGAEFGIGGGCHSCLTAGRPRDGGDP